MFSFVKWLKSPFMEVLGAIPAKERAEEVVKGPWNRGSSTESS